MFATPKRTPLSEIPKNNTPLRKSITKTKEIEAVNDEEERSTRRSMVQMQRRMSVIPNASPGPQVVSDSEIKLHFQTCLKMFTENKISSKNAWNLKIIDYMRSLLSSNGMALQIASTSLDVGAKIYGIRVDDICSDVYKLSSSMSRVATKETINPEEDETTEGAEAEETDKDPKKKKKKRRLSLSHKNTIKNFNSNLCDISKLPSASFSSRTIIDTSNINNLHMNQLYLNRDGYALLLLSKENEWNTLEDEDYSILCEEKYPFNIEPPQIPICQTFTNFHIDTWNPDEEVEMNRNSFDEVIYDDKGIPIAELDGSVHDIFAAQDAGNSTEEEEEGIGHVAIRNFEAVHIEDFRPSTSNIIENEYSYCILNSTNHFMTQIWAGPSHWKLKHVKPAVTIFSGQSIAKSANAKKPRKVRTEPKSIDFLNSEIPEVDSSKICKPVRNINTYVDCQKYNLPPNLAIDKQILNRLMLKPDVVLGRKSDNSPNIDCEVNPYNYDNLNDSQYCTQCTNNEDSPDNEGPDNEGLENEEHALPETNYMGENLVDAPELVQQMYIPYALQAKKVDMKKLKRTLWNCLLDTNFKESEEEKVKNTGFSIAYKQLRNKLGSNMKSELSCPLAFVALLHLTNEHNLKLDSIDGIRNFMIAQDYKPIVNSSGKKR